MDKIPGKKSRYTVLKLLLLILLLVILVFEFNWILRNSRNWENPPHLFGTRDFIAFWSGFQVFRDGDNPYIAMNVFRHQKPEIVSMTKPQVFLNPPWALPMLGPIMWMPFQPARYVWMLLNVVFLFSTGLVVRALFDNIKVPVSKLLVWTILFIPSLMTIWMGQLTLFVTFFLLAGILALKRRKDIVAGLLLVPITLKPHLVFLVLVVLTYWVIQNKRWKIVASGGTAFACLSALTEYLSPGIFANWRQMDFSPLIFKTSTIVTRIRELILAHTGTLPDWPVTVIPLLVSLTVFVWLLIRRPAVAWEYWLPPLLALSLFFAPYAWFYDYTLLLVLHLELVVMAYRESLAAAYRKEILVWLLAYQGLVIISGIFDHDLGAHYWFPLGVLLIWIRARKIIERTDAGTS